MDCLEGWMSQFLHPSINQLLSSQTGSKTKQQTLGRMSFSFFRTNRPSLSSLFQFSWTTRGFSSRSSWRSSNTHTDIQFYLRANYVNVSSYIEIILVWLCKTIHVFLSSLFGTHRHWRGLRTGSILAKRASSCLVWTSLLTSRWRPALSLCWTLWCTW